MRMQPVYDEIAEMAQQKKGAVWVSVWVDPDFCVLDDISATKGNPLIWCSGMITNELAYDMIERAHERFEKEWPLFIDGSMQRSEIHHGISEGEYSAAYYEICVSISSFCGRRGALAGEISVVVRGDDTPMAREIQEQIAALLNAKFAEEPGVWTQTQLID